MGALLYESVAHVLSELWFISEALPALGAGVWALSCMNSLSSQRTCSLFPHCEQGYGRSPYEFFMYCLKLFPHWEQWYGRSPV